MPDLYNIIVIKYIHKTETIRDVSRYDKSVYGKIGEKSGQDTFLTWI